MERDREDAALRALELAGICRETVRVIRSSRPGFSFMVSMVITLSVSLLAHVAIARALYRLLSDGVASSDAGAGLVRFATNWELFFLDEAACLLAILVQSLGSAAFCIFSVAPRYGVTDDPDARSIARDLRAVPGFLARYVVSVFRGNSLCTAGLVWTGPKVAWRLVATCLGAFLHLVGYTTLFGAAAWITRPYLLTAAPGEESSAQLSRAMLLLIGAGYLAGAAAARIGTVWRVACVMSVLVVQLALGVLVVDNRMGLGVLHRVAAGVVMAVALWAAVMAGLVAQVVVFFVCKGSSDGAGAPSNRESFDGVAANSD
ncbi:hypothetical protein CFC21_037547 [Triticum aestivum]|uniref:Uncharacterized protein n=3 Tax=Triticum TaxID=4564 RepID=A0A9R0VQJ5_TRITD|nr:hypothetical protein CFC21_037547 [Triticum aestivum]VAH67654.1 unnamed protein product [Triticum turgidum subsp. durum]